MEGGDERVNGQDNVDFHPMANSQSVRCPNFLDFVIGRHWVKIMEKNSKIIYDDNQNHTHTAQRSPDFMNNEYKFMFP